MPPTRAKSKDEIVHAAMQRFWTHGVAGSSIRDLIHATGSNRAALYSAFGGKEGLLRACLAAYREAVVTPAFARVEAPDAGLAEIRAYFEHQIDAAEAAGLPGPGCLIANMMTEVAPHEPEVRAIVEAHLARLRAGFRNALIHAAPAGTPDRRIKELADFLAISAQGLWSHSRQVEDAAPLRAHVATLIGLVEERLRS